MSKQQFSALLKETLRYLQEDLIGVDGPWHGASEKSEQPIFAPPDSAKSKAPLADPLSTGDKGEKPKTQVKEVKKSPPVKVTDWTLNPLSLPPDYPPAFTSYFKAIPLTIPIRLFVAESSQILFLENVSRAITRFIAPSMLFAGKLDVLLTNQNVHLILAPLSVLKKRFPQVELHCFLKIGGTALLPLADQYDLELKRNLWKCLKSFPDMPRSS